MKVKKAITKTKRTRDHVLATLSENFLEKVVITEGFTVQFFEEDYGYDAFMDTFDGKGEFENGMVYYQLKATDKIKFVKANTEVSFSIKKKHLLTWSKEPYPVILVIYDANNDTAYWQYIQRYMEVNNIDVTVLSGSLAIRIPKVNIVNGAAIQQIRDFKLKVSAQIKTARLIMFEAIKYQDLKDLLLQLGYKEMRKLGSHVVFSHSTSASKIALANYGLIHVLPKVTVAAVISNVTNSGIATKQEVIEKLHVIRRTRPISKSALGLEARRKRIANPLRAAAKKAAKTHKRKETSTRIEQASTKVAAKKSTGVKKAVNKRGE